MMLTAAELAAYLGVTPSAVRQAIRRHHIQPAWKIGRAKVYHRDAVLAVTGKRDRRAAVATDAGVVSH